MRNASISVIPHNTRIRIKSFIPFLSTSSSSYSSCSLVSATHLKSYSKTKGLFFRNRQFQANPSRNEDTLVENPPQLSSRQRKSKGKSQLEEAFRSADTAEEMLQAFKDMESVFDERELGLASLKLGLKLDHEGEDPEKTLSFANRALNALDKGDKPSFLVAMSLQLLAAFNYSLNRFNDSLGFLSRANRILGRFEEEGFNAGDLRPVLHAVHLELANVKTALGRREEAICNLMKCLEIKEITLEKDSRELGKANRDLAEAYVSILNFKEALGFCMKALDINNKQLGPNSVDVANDMRLEEHEKDLEQNVLNSINTVPMSNIYQYTRCLSSSCKPCNSIMMIVEIVINICLYKQCTYPIEIKKKYIKENVYFFF